MTEILSLSIVVLVATKMLWVVIGGEDTQHRGCTKRAMGERKWMEVVANMTVHRDATWRCVT